MDPREKVVEAARVAAPDWLPERAGDASAAVRECSDEIAVALLRLRTALAAHDAAQAAPVDAMPVSLLPLARGLLRDANDALDRKGGMRVGMPKATVDANRLRNVAAAVIAHLEAEPPQAPTREAEREAFEAWWKTGVGAFGTPVDSFDLEYKCKEYARAAWQARAAKGGA